MVCLFRLSLVGDADFLEEDIATVAGLLKLFLVRMSMHTGIVVM